MGKIVLDTRYRHQLVEIVKSVFEVMFRFGFSQHTYVLKLRVEYESMKFARKSVRPQIVAQSSTSQSLLAINPGIHENEKDFVRVAQMYINILRMTTERHKRQTYYM
jgi:hypothetical protein